jgi:hypothetical protein
LLVLSSPNAAAHHSFGDFDLSREQVIEGTVVAFEWINPHTVTRVAVAGGDGSIVVWRLEGMSPGYLGRRGWNRRTLGEGDTVEIVLYPLKSGAPGGMLVRATLADGTVKVMVDDGQPRDGGSSD